MHAPWPAGTAAGTAAGTTHGLRAHMPISLAGVDARLLPSEPPPERPTKPPDEARGVPGSAGRPAATLASRADVDEIKREIAELTGDSPIEGAPSLDAVLE